MTTRHKRRENATRRLPDGNSKDILIGAFFQIRAAFGMWVKADGNVNQGLVLRRELEAALFNEGRYSR
ncbi:MAG TPA: hypothetical protein VIS96_15150 [Terrimicrobiaceae bacterium]